MVVSSLIRPGRLSGWLRVGVGYVHSAFRAATRTWWREILLLGVLYGAYEVVRTIGDVDVPSALANGRSILHLERVWHLAPEHVLNAALSHALFIAVIASYFYSVMHYVITPTVLVWMYRKHRVHYGTARTALAISTALGLIGYLLLPTAPPRMLRGSGLSDTLADTASYGWWGGEGSVPRGFGAVTNQFAAMPSLHVGWALWCGVLVAIYARRRWVKLLGIAYPLATTVVVLATGNHYLLDAIAGALTMGAGALLASAFAERGRRDAATVSATLSAAQPRLDRPAIPELAARQPRTPALGTRFAADADDDPEFGVARVPAEVQR